MRGAVFVAHQLPGRLRIRLWRGPSPDPTELRSAAERVGRLTEVDRVDHHPVTGSLIVHYDPDRWSEDEVLDRCAAALGASKLVRPGEPTPPPTEMAVMGSRLARAVAVLFGELNADLYRATRGTADLRILLPLTFGGLGAAEVLVTGKLPAPPWFNLMWWSFRTFTTFNQEAIADAVGGEGGATGLERVALATEEAALSKRRRRRPPPVPRP
ncbi:hypothetical protein L6R50_24060 [Myxococcota bacterium]|nr:hypothetical protein [Myxococcota bacterium]